MLKSLRPASMLKHQLMRSSATANCLPVDPCDPAVNVTILPNGIRIATEFTPSPIACMTLLVEAGSRFETAHNNGTTHFLEHMAYKGFCGMSKGIFENHVLQMGAKMTAKTTREMQTFTGVCPSESVPLMVDNLASVVTNMLLDPEEIAAEKYNICLEMVDEDNDPRSVVFNYLHQTAFQGTPLAQGVIGPSWNVTRFDKEHLRQFLCTHYQPYKYTFSTVGAVDHQALVGLIGKRLGHLVGTPSCESDEGPTRFTGSQVMYRNDSMPFAHVAIAFEAPGYIHADYWKCLIASHMIGKWHKSVGGRYNNVSQTAQAAAVDDLCDYYEPFYITYRDIGLWGVYFVSKRMDLEDMMENVQDHFRQMCITSLHDDMIRALRSANLQVSKDVVGVVNSSMDIATQMFYRCSRMSLCDKLRAMTHFKHEALQGFLDNMMYDKCPVVVAVGPTENLPDYSRLRANQYWLRW